MRYFKNSEFNCKCKKCDNEHHMDMETLEMLETARAFAGIPLKINSAWRCEEYNASKKVGGLPTSSHLVGKAVDIRTKTPTERFWVVYGLIHAGFTRILHYKTFVHADTDIEKPREIMSLM